MTTPAKLKLTIYQGATFRRRLRWSTKAGAPIDLTGCSARMQVRSEIESPVALMEFKSGAALGENSITLGGADGTIVLYASAETTEAIAWDKGVWDMEIVMANGDVERLVAGSMVVSKGVTRG